MINQKSFFVQKKTMIIDKTNSTVLICEKRNKLIKIIMLEVCFFRVNISGFRFFGFVFHLIKLHAYFKLKKKLLFYQHG